ncbi:hypothetical protein KFU94_68780 [Chloroflexi bacterium TSY]|nr:hypothetical protein [Chloroflexi bacterium TSY]
MIELSPGENDLNWHAGLVLETPTAIELTNLSATIRRGDQGDVLVVKWSTSAETFTLGFHVHIGPNNNYTNATRKTSQMVFSQGSQGGSYEARIPYDAQTDPSLEKMRIWLVEIDINNNELTYGPTLVSRSRFIFLPFITSGGATDGSPRGPRGAVPSSQPTDNLESREVEQPQKVMKIDERVARWVCHVLRDAAISSASPNPIVRGFGRLCDR